MTDITSTPSASWDKLLPEGSTQSAAINYYLFWHDMAIRKIHMATIERGEFDILLRTEPVGGWDADDLLLLAAATVPRPAPVMAMPDGAATAIQLSRYTADHARFKMQNELYQKQQAAMNTVKDQMVGSLDKATLDTIFPNPAALLEATFSEIFASITQHFSELSTAHLLAMKADLRTAFVFDNPNAYEARIANDTRLNRALVRAGETRSEFDKVSDSRTSLLTSTHADLFKFHIAVYDTSHRSVLSQSITDFNDANAAAVPALLATLVAPHYGANGAAQKGKQPNSGRTAPRKARPVAWCWTHGTTHHTSSECRNKAVGHQDKATSTNKMGGKE